MNFKECTCMEEILSFLNDDDRATHHTYYYHYTRLHAASDIVKGQKLWLSNLCNENANDITEKNWYVNNGVGKFSVCFATGTSESIPLWYLYSENGHGARLEIDKKTFVSWYRSKENLKPKLVFGNKNEKETIELSEQDYDLLVRDILYLDKDSEKENYRAKYCNQSLFGIDCTEEDFASYRGFIKGLVWFYEKETRMQIEITNQEYLEKIKTTPECHVEVDIASIIPKMTVTFAPEYLEQINKTHVNEIRDEISQHVVCRDSTYAGKISMARRQTRKFKFRRKKT